jgi:hypothetical protein
VPNEIPQLLSLKSQLLTKDLNKSVEEAISNNEFQKPVVKLSNELSEETQKLVADLKEAGTNN